MGSIGIWQHSYPHSQMLKDSTNENEGQIRYLEGTNYGIKLTTSNKKKRK